MFQLKTMSARHFDIFRTLMGLGIFVIYGLVFQNWKATFINHDWMFWILIIGLISSLSFALNIQRKVAAVITISVMILINRLNPFAIKVVHGYISWILFCTLFIPEGEGSVLLRRQSDEKWIMPFPVQLALSIVIAFSLTFSGIWKGLSPLWREGLAMDLFMQNPRFNWELSPLLAKIPYFGQASSHLVWIGEILFFPFYFFSPTRRVTWFIGMILIASFFFLMHIYVVAMMMLIILTFLYPGRETV